MKYVENSKFDVAVIGLGYVGLPAALMWARAGLQVAGVDINEKLIEKLKDNIFPFEEEKDLVEIFRNSETQKNLYYFESPPVADAYVIAVPTPLHRRRKSSDLTALLQAVSSLVGVLRKNCLTIVESTIPPLTCRDDVTPLLEKSGLKVGRDIFLAHCPERLFPGNITKEIIDNDRIIGGVCPVSKERAQELYKIFVKGELCVTDEVTAEFCKLMENTYRDVNIALANELDLVANNLGIDIHEAISLSNRHPRVNILKPGIGVGGHCIPIDPWFIHEVCPEETVLIPTARRINDARPQVIASKIRHRLASLKSPKIGFYGVTYKPDVRDERESPAHEVIRILGDEGWDYEVFDPMLSANKSVFDFAKEVDVLVVLVPHQEIRNILSTVADREKLVRSLGKSLVISF